MAFRSLSKKAIGCMRVAAFIGAAIFDGALVIVRLILWGAEVPVPQVADIGLATFLVLTLVYCWAAPLIRYRRYRYDIDEERIIIEEGLWFLTKQMAPIERVHQIAVNRGPIDRLYGLGKVVVTTAGGTIIIRFVEVEQAEQIAASLMHRIRGIVQQQTADQA